MSSPYTPTEAQIQARMTAQTPHLTHQEARWSLIKAHLETQQDTAPHTISSFDFFARIPDATWSKIRAASLAENDLGIALHRGLLQLSAAQNVTNNDPQLLAMLTALTVASIITDAERLQIIGF